jgi:hypothetical protein
MQTTTAPALDALDSGSWAPATLDEAVSAIRVLALELSIALDRLDRIDGLG